MGRSYLKVNCRGKWCISADVQNGILKLCTIIHPHIQVDTEMFTCRALKSPVIFEIVLHCLLWWLDVGNYLDIWLCAGFSSAVEVHRCNFELWIIGMKVSRHRRITRWSWTGIFIAKLSGCNKGVLHVYMGLLQIQVSSSSETGNVKTHFSGHYQIYRINVEPACD